MFRAIISPILRSTRLCLQLVVSSIDGAANMQRRRGFIPQSSATEDGRIYRPKHVELIEIINKLLLLNLVGCLYYCISDALSHKHQNEPRIFM